MRDMEIMSRMKPEPPTEREWDCMGRLNPVDYEILRRKIELIGEEAKEVTMRTAVAPTIRAGDMNVGIYTAQGDMALSATGTFVHAVLQQIPLKYVLKHFRDDPTVGLRDGDIFFCNEAVYGGVHNPDMMVFIPIFHQGELVSWSASLAHQGECGARNPGGFTPHAQSRYEEGMHITPIKIGENFQLKADLMEMMENMTRSPREQTMDTKARLAACYRIRTRLLEIIEEKDAETLIGALRKMIYDNEQAICRKMSQWNDGTYRAVGFFDTIGIAEGLLKVSLAVKKQGDRVTLDFSGSSPETPGPFNSMRHLSASCLGSYLAGFVCSDLTLNAGFLEPFDFIFPEGTVINCGPESACALGIQVAYIVMDVISTAFAKMIFDSEDSGSSAACWYSVCNGPFYGGYNQRGIPIAALPMEINAGGGCASATVDGVNAAAPIWALVTDMGDLEFEELDYPILYLHRNKYLKDLHGYGMRRGGAGIDVAYMVHNTQALVMGSFGQGNRFPVSSGLFGGYGCGSPPAVQVTNSNVAQMLQESSHRLPQNSRELIEQQPFQGEYEITGSNRDVRLLPDKSIFVMSTGGGGGYGDVLERDPDAVMCDLRDQLISHWVAQNVYRVAYDPETLAADRLKTAEQRQEEREARKRRGKSCAEFLEEWQQKKPRAELLNFYGQWPEAVR